MKNNLITRACLFLAVIFGGAPEIAQGHEFWLAPSSFRPVVGNRVELFAIIGLGTEAEAYSRHPDHIERFVVRDRQGERPVTGRKFRMPTGSFRVRTSGIQIIGYQSTFRTTSLPEEQFNKYLVEEGLDTVLKERELAGESSHVGRERYSRCAKALLQSEGQGRDRPLGLPLEIIAIDNPFQLKPGELLTVQLLWQERPLSGVLLKGFRLEDCSTMALKRTDGEGQVKLRLDHSGRWMLNAVHMLREIDFEAIDWRSYWASLTFELPEEDHSE